MIRGGKGAPVVEDDGFFEIELTNEMMKPYSYNIDLYFGQSLEKMTLNIDTGCDYIWIKNEHCENGVCEENEFVNNLIPSTHQD